MPASFVRWTKPLLAVVLIAVFSSVALAQGRGRSAEARKLQSETGAKISIHPVTGAARFVAAKSKGESLAKGVAKNATAEEKSAAFFQKFGDAFGVKQFETELQLRKQDRESNGAIHLTYQQQYLGIPVFGAELKTHTDSDGDLQSVNGTFIPDIAVDPTPALSADQAASLAAQSVKGGSDGLQVVSKNLYIYQLGLTKGVDEGKYLVYEVAITNGGDYREFLYIDAHTGALVERITGVYDAMFRRAYNANNLTNNPPLVYPGTPFWVEGDAFPTGNTEANNMLLASKDTYDFYFNAFGRDSFDGAGKIMDSIFNRGYQCPNASWNGTFISFCPGMTSDDVTAHEWSHAYTEYTHGLIYLYQSGALNEAYSDIFGETVDFLNGRGTDSPLTPRTDACSQYQVFAPVVIVSTPANIAGTYSPVGTSSGWGGAYTNTGVTGNIVYADDDSLVAPLGGAGDVHDACTALTPANAALVAGNIAFVNRGGCGFKLKAFNVQQAGAAGVIIGNISAAQALANMADDATVPAISIPAVLVHFNAGGNAIRTELAAGNPVTGSIKRNSPAVTDNSYRWLVGEDDTAVGLVGALRDMANPSCFGDPAKVTDTFYTCSAADEGGVHTNSGVPNKAYQLIVDGGTFNGQTVTGIGLTKAAHIYFRAEEVYQNPATNFAEHADAIEQSCSDLIGVNLADLSTGAPSGQTISAGDCAEVAKAMLATEMRTPPTQCNFQPILQKSPPNRCGAGTTQVDFLKEDFESLPVGWGTSNTPLNPATFTQRNWVWSNQIPIGKTGSAFFGIDQPGGSCTGASEAGVIHLESPLITLPEGGVNPLLTFDHWIATEAGWDGGNLKVSIDGGAWTAVPTADFTYNPYNANLNTVGAGNNNPEAGKPAFTGADGGSAAGSWGRSHVKLTGATGGSAVRLRWDMSTDVCTGTFGWYVDDVTVYNCLSTAAPQLSVNDITVTEGNAGKTAIATFTISLDHASTQSVTVGYKTGKGTAKTGTDYVPMEGTVIFPPLTLTQHVTVIIRGDSDVEPNENFFLTLRQPINGVIADSEGQCTITNDD